jgi:hypothetical protein
VEPEVARSGLDRCGGGVHLVPLAPLLHYPLLYPVATVVTIAALVAVPVARRARSRSVPSTGLGLGTTSADRVVLALAGALTHS